MKNKIVAGVLAMAMVLGSSVTAFAADITAPTDGVYAANLSIGSETNLPTIKVTVPDSVANIVVNPYKMKYTDAGSVDHTDQIIATEETITNESDVAIAVNVAELKAEVASGSEVVFATAPLTDPAKLTTKSVFMYLDIVDKAGTFGTAFDKTKNIVVGTKAVKKDNVVVMDAKDGAADGAKFTLKGETATKPAKDWATTDTFTTSLKFTFTPQVVTTTAP